MSENSKSSTSNPSVPKPSKAQLSTLQRMTTDFSAFRTTIIKSQEAILKIASQGQYVTIDGRELKKNVPAVWYYMLSFIKKGDREQIAIQPFRLTKDYFPVRCPDDVMVDWIFMLNALNFSLWSPYCHKPWTVHHLTGYKALCAAIKRAIVKEGRPIWNPYYYSMIDREEIGIIFRSDDNETTIPLIGERIRILHDIGKVLISKYKGSFINCIKACSGDALKLWHLLYTEFESYTDVVNYNGQNVCIGGKVAALISDLGFFYKVTGDTHCIPTVLSDHRVPDILLHFKILRYSDRLKARLAERDKPLEHGSEEEVEMRCCLIVATYAFCQEVTTILSKREGVSFTERNKVNLAIAVDNFLWDYRHLLERNGSLDDAPYHNIKSIYF